MNVGTPNAAVEVTLSQLTTPTWGAILLNANASSSIMVRLTSAASNNLKVVTDTGATTTLGQTTVSATDLGSTPRLRAKRNGETITVSVNGVLRLTVVLTTGQQSAYTSNNFGIATSNTTTRFDDFWVTTAATYS
jgi:hypothetical protein